MYKINEIFESLQGEGAFTGLPSVFLRLQGCLVGCAWCDTKQTWETRSEDETSFEEIIEKKTDSPLWAKTTTETLLSHIHHAFKAKHLVITGGEPCMVDLRPLTEAFELKGYRCQIETSGTYPIKASQNAWVTVSPKVGMRGKRPILQEALERANEIKHPVGTDSDIENLKDLLKQIDIKDKIISVQPISQKEKATSLCIEMCLKYNWRLSLQTHKYLRIA